MSKRATNFDEIIDAFKSRVNKLSQDWDSLLSHSIETSDDEIELMKKKLDLVQEQNSAIIVDLDHIKKLFNLEDDASNNVFSLLTASEDPTSIAANAVAAAEAAAVAEAEAAAHHAHQLQQMHPMLHHPGSIGSLDLETELSVKKRPSTQKKSNGSHAALMESFELTMNDNPKSVGDLYDEFHNSLKQQILDFEKKCGKGQLSKISKIRTFQRRRALVTEIEKHSAFAHKTIDESIAYFEQIRNEKQKSVAWLYNNLGKILNEEQLN